MIYHACEQKPREAPKYRATIAHNEDGRIFESAISICVPLTSDWYSRSAESSIKRPEGPAML